jgi:leucine dehydrogenase
MVFDAADFSGHEAVHHHHDAATGLRAIIAIHSTALGPAAGGCRRWTYPSAAAALSDALRLSEAMTWKNALAGLPLGGGKSVLLAEPGRTVSLDELHAFGRWVQALGGRYWTAEDVGIGPAQVAVIAETTDYTFGVEVDPSPHTAYGAFMGIIGAVEHRYSDPSLHGRRVAVQGVGHVGSELCRLLSDAGAELTVADVDTEAVDAVARRTGATRVGTGQIFDADVDVFAPCALGGVLDDDTIPRLRAAIVAGVANNQLAEPRHGAQLTERGIVYVPDFIVNSGGMLSAADPILGRVHDAERTRRLLEDIRHRVIAVLERADAEGSPPSEVAVQMAREIVAGA